MSSSVETWERVLKVGKNRYTAVFTKRPFREGLEVVVKVGKTTLRVADLGLGEKALLAHLKAQIERL